jgi:hypothetical protein
VRASAILSITVFFAACQAEQEPFIGLVDPKIEGNEPADPDDPSDPADPAGPTEGQLPCNVDRVLAARCRSCHSDPPRYGAPMALASWEDVHAPAVSDASRPVYELMRSRIADDRRPMPPTGDLPQEERAILEDWLSKNAPGAKGETCDAPLEPEPTEIEPLPCTPTHRITAHARGSEAAFTVPMLSNSYQCFTMRSPFGPTTQATAWAPIIDDDRVVHHWILYGTKTEQVEGGVGPCNMPADATFVAGWAPGGGSWILPEDVSLELPGPNQWLILQVHYHNDLALPDANDKSGVEICTTNTPREKVAGFVTLGSIWLDIPPGAEGYSITGECAGNTTRFLQQDLTFLASFPHMHQLGRSFRSEIVRKEGNRETILEVPHFDFESQQGYTHTPPVVFRPGDAIRTTCVYDNPTSRRVRFGERTEDEMCLDFVMLYPITAIGDSRSCGLF